VQIENRVGLLPDVLLSDVQLKGKEFWMDGLCAPNVAPKWVRFSRKGLYRRRFSCSETVTLGRF
jgi:hypothetical protein